MSQALYRKWRPHLWAEVIGQAHIVQTLRHAVASGREAHAYLFAGPRGTGKTTTARLLAKAVNCLHADLANRPCDQCECCQAVNQGRFLDLIEIDAASNTSVEDVRSLRDKINFAPNQGRYKVYIIDEVHMLSTAAFNALLKTLEEPPPHAIFILATTEIHKIPATVLSRCQRHEFRRIPVADIVHHLKAIAENERLDVDEEALTLVARQATGAMRDAISLLDQLSSTGQKITLEITQQVLGTAASQAVIDLVETILNKEPSAGLAVIQSSLDAGTDARQLARQVVEYLRNLMLIRNGNAGLVESTNELRAQMARQAQGFEAQQLVHVIRAFNQAASEGRGAWIPSLLLELALMESLQEPAPLVQSEPILSITKAAQPARPAREKAAATAAELSPEASSISGEDAGGVTLKLISSNWQKVLSVLTDINKNTAALLRSGKLLGVKDGAVYLGYSDVLKEKMERSENIDLVRKALQKVLNIDVPVHCVVYTGKPGALPPDVESDGMVATALRDLGGEIVDVQ